VIFLQILFLKIKNTLRHRHNLILLTALPAIAAAGAWALLTFYLEGGADIPVGVLDYDGTEFSGLAVARFSENATIGVREFVTVGFEPGGDPLAAVKDDAAYIEATRLVRVGALEAAIVIMPGFSNAIYGGAPEGVFHVVSPPSGIGRGLAAELFAAQVSRLFFNCDSANRVVKDAEAAAKSAQAPPLTEREKKDLFEEAFRYCDSYWEPEPLMSIEYTRYEAAQTPGGAPVLAALAGGAGGWQGMREMLNDLIARGVYAVFIAYAVFCVINATGVMIAERADGVLTRIRACGLGAFNWVAASAAAPFILYGIPCAILLSVLTNDRDSAVFAFWALLCASAAGALAAFSIKKPGVYKAFTLAGVLISVGASIYIL